MPASQTTHTVRIASWDDVDDVHISWVFYDPVILETTDPFAVPKQQNTEKMFEEMKNQRVSLRHYMADQFLGE